MFVDFAEMDAGSRLWVYQTNRDLSDEECQELFKAAQKFADSWLSHGQTVKASALVIYNRFLVLLADEQTAQVSGCSIDSSVAFVREMETKLGLDFFDRRKVVFVQDEQSNVTNCLDFGDLAEWKAQGKISDNSLIFNNLVNSKKAFEDNWKQKVSESWLAAHW